MRTAIALFLTLPLALPLALLTASTSVAHGDCQTYDEGFCVSGTDDIVEQFVQIDQFGASEVGYVRTGTQSYISISSGDVGDVGNVELKFSVDNEGLYPLIMAPEDISTCRTVTYLVDSDKGQKKASVYSANDYTLGFEEPLDLLLRLLGHDSLTVRYTSVWDEPREVIFYIGGIENAVENILPFNKTVRKKVERFMKAKRIKRKMECDPI